MLIGTRKERKRFSEIRGELQKVNRLSEDANHRWKVVASKNPQLQYIDVIESKNVSCCYNRNGALFSHLISSSFTTERPISRFRKVNFRFITEVALIIYDLVTSIYWSWLSLCGRAESQIAKEI